MLVKLDSALQTLSPRLTQHALHPRIRLLAFLRQLALEVDQPFGERRVGDSQDLDRQQSGVGRAADADRGHRHARRHLHDREQRVEPAGERRSGSARRSPADGCARPARRAGAPRRRRPRSARASRAQPRSRAYSAHLVRAAVSREHAHLAGDAEAIADLVRLVHHRPVGVAAHQDADERRGRGAAVIGSRPSGPPLTAGCCRACLRRQ